MNYVFLVYADGEAWAREEAVLGAGEIGSRAGRAQSLAVTLLPPETATTVRIRGGEALLSDRPATLTELQLVALHLVNCRDEADAIGTAGSLCAARGSMAGCIEVRPVLASPAESWPGTTG